jgi:putative ABC transport system permease protein
MTWIPPANFLLALRQLLHARTKFVVAVAGVAVAVLLMLVQLGLRDTVYEASMELPNRLRAEAMIVSPRTVNLQRVVPFAERLASRAMGVDGVEAITPIFIGLAQWKNPKTLIDNPIKVYGFDLAENLLGIDPTFDTEKVQRLADAVVFDRLSRDRFGPVLETVESGRAFPVEVNGRRVEVVGITRAGATLDQDGVIFTSGPNFLRLFPQRFPGAIDLAVVKLRPGSDHDAVVEAIRARLGREVQVLTRDQLIQKEQQFMKEQAPIDFIFLLGAMVGFFVGGVVIYQILYSDVSSSLPQYATLKAIGFQDQFLMGLVIHESLIMAVAGYIPGFIGSLFLYDLASDAIELDVHMTVSRASLVFGLTTLMCVGAALIVMQKLRRSDPADVF